METKVKNNSKLGYKSAYNRIFKRCLDFTIALIAIIVLLPIILLFALAVLIDDGFPIFYTPPRGGYKGKPFKIIKYRTMVRDADKIGGGTTALNDPRITKVGSILRKVKADEIVQIFNVLTGTMSFVGPRPELLQYTEQYTEEESVILKVRPGITDYSSLEFINLDEIVGGENADEMYEKYVLKRKNQLRMQYAEEVSLKTDFIILFKTVWFVLEKFIKFFRVK
ncbi:MAG: sugar transferase [Acutalibacteraceae bacterium]|nr:sugar transferase [Acutalibacteraceae bacterium]